MLIIAFSWRVDDPSMILSSVVSTREAVTAKLSSSSVPTLSSLISNETTSMLLGLEGKNSTISSIWTLESMILLD